MNLLLFLSLILTLVSCAETTVSNQPSVYHQESTIVNYPAYSDYQNSKLRFIWPVKGEVVDSFGEKLNNISNKGINIKAKSGDTVVASEGGRAIYANQLKGWGKTLILKHFNDYYTVYANLEDISVKEGFSVKKGEAVGRVCMSNKRDTVLHFEIRKRYLADNPLRYLKSN